MSSLVAQHQLTSYATPIAGGPGTASVVLGNDNATVTGYNAHDADTTIHVQDSALASRPAALTVGRKWMTTDVGAVYLFYDNGSSWVEVNYQRTASTGAVTITSTTTPQLTVAYDGSHSATFSVSAAGLLTVNATTTITITPAMTVTGVLTLSAQPILSTLTASQAVFTDSSKGLVSNAITGTGNVVMSASPTLTGTISAAALTLSGVLTYGGVALNAAVTGTGNMVLSASPTLTGTTTAATLNATTLGGTLSTAAQPNVTSVGTLTSLTVSGVITASGGVTINGGTNAAGSIFKNATVGLTLQGITGSTHDFAILTPAGTGPVIGIPTGTANVTFAGTVTAATGLTVSAGTTAVQALTATAVTISTSGTSSTLIIDTTAGNVGDVSQVLLRRNTTLKWQVGNNVSLGGDVFEIYSTVAGGYAVQINPTTKAVTCAAGITATTGTFSGALSGITTLAMSGALSGATTGAFSSTLGVNGGVTTSVTLSIGGTATTTGTTQAGVSSRMTAATGATTRVSAFDCLVQTQASAVTYTELIGLHIADAILGATSAITTQYGLHIDSQTKGSKNYAIKTLGGNVGFVGLPTSSAGLASGDVWANANVLTVVP